MNKMGGLRTKLPITFLDDVDRDVRDRSPTSVLWLFFQGPDPRSRIRIGALVALVSRCDYRGAHVILHVPLIFMTFFGDSRVTPTKSITSTNRPP